LIPLKNYNTDESQTRNIKQRLKALKLSENDLKASSRVCSFHFFGNERKKNEVPSLEIGEKFGAKSGGKNPKDKVIFLLIMQRHF
jgi:hypothetical protein